MSTVLFVTRKFPPSVGGMETLAADVWHALEGDGARLVAHGGSNRSLPAFLVRAVRTTRRAARRREVDLVLAGDVLMFLALRPFVRPGRVRLATMAMGKDVVWPRRPYQWLVRRWLPDAHLVLAISQATEATTVAAGVPPDAVRVVRLGVEVPERTVDRPAAHLELRSSLGVDPGAVVIATLGRLVRRKGVAWFIREVLPGLPAQCVYVVAGDGEDRADVLDARASLEDPGRVRLLGRVDDAGRELLLRGCDVFAQPNIPVDGDMEGFGLVAVEAAMRGALVVAADLEGLRDAVVDGETGILVAPQDTDAWVRALDAVVGDAGVEALAERYASGCRQLYSRERMGAELRQAVGLAPSVRSGS
ncbi:glycosyltransferase family 4 protein [Cellulomonas sp. URHD0024]|uniref:glycosyltransferase family 4 protein n=1 Tax=Cellulomonas sp. URHD0024 TaxID=1302620 RepID=UPI0003FDFE66|nr:glycosyltransferase family 4 protein [Cellulomonas sp. URHD0024]